MKTLSKEITATFYPNSSGYYLLRAHWSELMQDKQRRKELTAAHHLLYLILCGKNWQRAFSPLGGMNGPQTEARRVRLQKLLDNGGFYNWGAKRAVNALHSWSYEQTLLAPFAKYICKDTLGTIRQLVPPLSWDESPLDREPYVG